MVLLYTYIIINSNCISSDSKTFLIISYFVDRLFKLFLIEIIFITKITIVGNLLLI